MKLTQILRDASTGAIVPGSITYIGSKYAVEEEVNRGIKEENRSSSKLSTKDRFIQGCAALVYGFVDFSTYFLYSTAFLKPAGRSIDEITKRGIIQSFDYCIDKFVEDPSSAVEVIVGLGMIAGVRAGLYCIHKSMYLDEHKKVEEHFRNADSSSNLKSFGC